MLAARAHRLAIIRSMTHDDNSSKAKTPPIDRKARARTVAAGRDVDRMDAEDQPSVDTDRPYATLVEPALTLPVSEPAPSRSIGSGFGAFAVVLLIGGSVALLMTREPRYPKIEAARSDPPSITEAPSGAPAPVAMPTAPAAAEPPISPATAAAPTPMVPSADAPPPPEPEQDPVEQLRELAKLRDEGILTDEEFAAQKRKILG